MKVTLISDRHWDLNVELFREMHKDLYDDEDVSDEEAIKRAVKGRGTNTRLLPCAPGLWLIPADKVTGLKIESGQ